MKGKLLIVFYSKYGYVKRYVDIIGNALGCDAVPLDKLKKDMFGYDKYLFISSVRGGVISEFKKFAKYLPAVADKLVVCAVGMLPRGENTEKQLKENTIPVEYEDKLPVFYAQGGFDMNELSGGDKMRISMIEKQLKGQSEPGEVGEFVLAAIKTPVDEVKTANIKQLIDFLDGKFVDRALYCPPAEGDGE